VPLVGTSAQRQRIFRRRLVELMIGPRPPWPKMHSEYSGVVLVRIFAVMSRATLLPLAILGIAYVGQAAVEPFYADIASRGESSISCFM